MTCLCSSLAQQVKEFCAQIGSDPLLVQGPGGNISWKEGNVLWIKASGKWLADANLFETFVPVNLKYLQEALAQSDFTVTPQKIDESPLRPSIETLLHVLLPHKVVVHLHPVEILVHLVRSDPSEKIARRMGQKVEWLYIDYVKPGADLAKAVSRHLVNAGDISVVFLGNHGVLIGGETVREVGVRLDLLVATLQSDPVPSGNVKPSLLRTFPLLLDGYVISHDAQVNRLAVDESLLQRLRTSWALYPDHVVFLGAAPVIIESDSSSCTFESITITKPPFVFVVGDAVYESLEATPAQRSQLRCYYDVVVRLSLEDKLTTLTDEQVLELIIWEPEKHRLQQDAIRS
jgi:rhamnose utilization protein RhaD (predicted bifunctional aldolase and dehydrogenase)